jgi:hypothetical protein
LKVGTPFGEAPHGQQVGSKRIMGYEITLCDLQCVAPQNFGVPPETSLTVSENSAGDEHPCGTDRDNAPRGEPPFKQGGHSPYHGKE